MKAPLLQLVLVASVAFNLGFAGSLVRDYLGDDTEPDADRG